MAVRIEFYEPQKIEWERAIEIASALELGRDHPDQRILKGLAAGLAALRDLEDLEGLIRITVDP